MAVLTLISLKPGANKPLFTLVNLLKIVYSACGKLLIFNNQLVVRVSVAKNNPNTLIVHRNLVIGITFVKSKIKKSASTTSVISAAHAITFVTPVTYVICYERVLTSVYQAGSKKTKSIGFKFLYHDVVNFVLL